MVPANSEGVSPAPTYSGGDCFILLYLYVTITLYGCFFQKNILIQHVKSCCHSYNPTLAETSVVWTISVSLATTSEIITYFFFLRILRCFNSPSALLIRDSFSLQKLGYPIRKSTDLKFSASPRSLSQLNTSFIGIKSQGIHYTPLVAFSTKTTHCVVRKYPKI